VHVEQRLAGFEPEDIDRTIVNPRHLTRELRESVCAQCHLQGAVSVTVRGRSLWDYRPGLPLREFRLDFREESPSSEIRVAGHVEQLHRSLCYQRSESLTCITCHEPHAESPPSERLTRQRNNCLSCHEQQPCLIPHAERVSSNRDNCIACHMPQASTEVTHVALTNHRIGIYDASDSSGSNQNPHEPGSELMSLQPLDHLSDADRERSRGLAYLNLVRSEGNAVDQLPRLNRAAELLRSAYDRGLRDPELLTSLAGLTRDPGSIDEGIDMATRAVNSPEITPEVRLEALDVLTELYLHNGDLPKAAEYLREIVDGNRSAFHCFLSGQIEQQLGNSSEALDAFREAVHLDPRNAEFRRVLAQMLEEAGLQDEAARHRRLAEQLSKANE
jgi:tetratricopeptide (TPR) repeat protein